MHEIYQISRNFLILRVAGYQDQQDQHEKRETGSAIKFEFHHLDIKK
jgi:hypothetical protein